MATRLVDVLGKLFYSKWQLVRVAHVMALLTIWGEGYMMKAFFPNDWDSELLRYLGIISIALAFCLTFSRHRDKLEWVFVLCYEVIQFAVLATMFHNGLSIRLLVQVLVILIMIGSLIEAKWLLWAHYIATLVAVVGVVWLMEGSEMGKSTFLEIFLIIYAIGLWGTFWIRRSRERLNQLIAEKSAANQKLTHAKNILEKSQSVAKIGSWEEDLLTHEVNWAKETYAIFEVAEGEAINDDWLLKLLGQEGLGYFKDTFRYTLKTGEPFDIKLPVVTGRGSKKYVRVVGYGERQEGYTVRLYGVCQDITKDHEAELNLLQAKEEAELAQKKAELASQAKSQFLSVMSHEIRTPMNAVVGITHLLLEEQPRPEQIDNLESLKFSAENLLSIINDILDFSKIEAGKVELEEAPFTLSRMIKGIAQAYTYQANEKGIYLNVVVDDTIPDRVVGDVTRLTQIITNLVSNAIKFTKVGGVTIKFELIALEEETTKFLVAVQDTGIGIAPEKLSRIFESFTQAKSDITRKYGGTGLGLAITKKLLALFGSQICVESEEGIGTTFSFALRLNRPQAGEAGLLEVEQRKSEPTYEIQEGKILLVEDNLINIKVATKFLEKWGFTVEVAQNGRLGVEKAKDKRFDCILMDLQMPELDGFRATEAIRAFDPLVPIIALTAEATDEIRQQVLAAGMNDYSSKPFVPAELKKKIQRQLEKAQFASF